MPSAMFAGSFDPLHRGHLGIIEAGARLFDQLWVVAAGNPAKQHGLLSLEQRRELITASTDQLSNVEAVAHPGLLMDLAASLGVDALVRSIGKERGHEFEMAHANSCLSGVATVFLLPRRETWWISSRLVRERFNEGDLRAVSQMVPPAVASALEVLSQSRLHA